LETQAIKGKKYILNPEPIIQVVHEERKKE
jgi:hypothetical protein